MAVGLATSTHVQAFRLPFLLQHRLFAFAKHYTLNFAIRIRKCLDIRGRECTDTAVTANQWQISFVRAIFTH